MHANGPAVCFSRRNPTTAPGRIMVPRVSGATKLSRCKEGLARVFAVMVRSLMNITRVAVQVWSEPGIYHGAEVVLRALAQCRGTICLGARKLSRCRSLIGGRCGCPGLRCYTNLSGQPSRNGDKKVKRKKKGSGP